VDTSPWSFEELEAFPATVLKDEGDHSALLVRYETPDGPVVLKSWKPVKSRVYRTWARILMGREIRFSAALDGTPGIPRFLGRLDAVSFVMEWVPGEPLGRHLPQERIDAALDAFERTLAELHGRSFAHLDMHQKLNLLVGPAGECWLVDLGQGALCPRWPMRWLFPVLRGIDRRAVTKFRARYAPHTLPEAQREALVARHNARRGRAWKNFHRKLRELFVGERS
jgi:hypothetical protein